MNKSDQYFLKFKVQTTADVTITPENSYDVCIMIGGCERSYRKGELTFNAEDNCYEYPLTQDMTLAMSDTVQHQTRVVFGGEECLTIISSAVKTIAVGDTIFTRRYTGGDE